MADGCLFCASDSALENGSARGSSRADEDTPPLAPVETRALDRDACEEEFEVLVDAVETVAVEDTPVTDEGNCSAGCACGTVLEAELVEGGLALATGGAAERVTACAGIAGGLEEEETASDEG